MIHQSQSSHQIHQGHAGDTNKYLGCFLLLCSFYCVDPLSALIMTTSYDITLNPSKGGFYSLAVLGSGHLTSLVA